MTDARRTWSVVWVVVVLLMTLGLARVEARADDQQAGATPQPSPGTSSFALGEIGVQAESASAQLRAMSQAISSDDPAIAALENEIFRYRQRVSEQWAHTDHMLAGTPRRSPVEALASSWRTLRIEIVALRGAVDERTHRDEADLRTLDRLQASWRWTLDRARAGGAPPPTVGRVESTLAAIAATRAQVEQQNARLLVLQDALTQSVEACDDASARLADARHQAVVRVFSRHEFPIWKIRSAWAQRATETSRHVQLSDELAARVDSVRLYTQVYRAGSVLTALLALALTLMLYRARARAARDPEGSALPESLTHVFRAPGATALVVALLLSRPFRPDPPLALIQLIFLIGFPAALAVLRPLVDPHLVGALYAVMVLFVVDVVRALLFATPVLEQVVLIPEMAIAAALFFWLAARVATSAGALTRLAPWLRAAARRLFLAVALATLAASVAATLGYLEFADLVGGGSLSLAYVLIGLLSMRIAVGGVLELALVRSPLAQLHTFGRHGARIERIVGRALEIAAVAFWMFFALQRFELLDLVSAALRGALDAKLQVGELELSVGRVLGFVAVVIAAWLTSRVVVFAFEEDVYPRLQLPRGVPYALSSLIRYGLLLAGFFLALATLGLDLTRLTVLVSAFGLGLGFGMQQIINNFVSGLILLFERPVQVGDSVQLGDMSGQMVRIGIRSSTIRTADGADVIVPNSKLIEERVTNWTLSDRRRRVDLALRVAYGTGAERVLALLVEVAKRDPRVLPDPAPEALLTGFADSAIEFQLRAWTEDPHWTRLRSDLGVAIQAAMSAAQIETPRK